MGHRRSYQSESDALLRRFRRLMAAAHGVGACLPRAVVRSAHYTLQPLPLEKRQRIIGLIAELDLMIKAMRAQRDELGRKAGLVFRNRCAVSAYHRTGLLIHPGKHSRQ